MQFKHTIIGAGPVGLTLALFFKKFQIPFALYEQQKCLTSHPSAHYINMRSREIFAQLFNVNQLIDEACEPIENFRHYTYIRRIGEEPFHQTDQLRIFPTLDKYSFIKPVHLPQSELVKVLFKNLETEQNIHFGKKVKQIKIGKPIELILDDGSKVETEYLYGCDGLNGLSRESADINLVGQRDIQSFINLHFESMQLAEILKPYKSMLTFVYNSDVTAVLISHKLSTGMFNIQVPIDLIMTDIKWEIINDQNLLKHLIGSMITTKINDINIKHVGIWRMGAVVAQRYFKDNVVLLGDSAHSVPPAGGFGMNIGIQDAHNLIHTINSGRSFSQYSLERKQSAMSLLNIALKYYEKSLKISRAIGYDYNHLKTYQGVMKYFSNSFYRSGVKIGGSLLETDYFMKRAKNAVNDLNEKEGMIPMVFPKEETEIKYGQKGLLIPNIQVMTKEGIQRLREYLHIQQLQTPKAEFILKIGNPIDQCPNEAIEIKLLEESQFNNQILRVRSDLHIKE